jgi:hypothetical protein
LILRKHRLMKIVTTKISIPLIILPKFIMEKDTILC